ncbi:hypothetical protein [Pseudidiomarina marina]|uniref:Secreted protein n=1 Tax=Pseudidiomarina marina TaxID=502366 RepID=A0A432YEA8_9GAMM|nr:hypothetical protein [Pseudidiomarina marina]PHR66267.1 MAG: hypothetical protein COA51_02805 [Idiomarina sp.]RUO59278.1 hypothetical protein CWI76_09610 [Pseudidiomarina marina]
MTKQFVFLSVAAMSVLWVVSSPAQAQSLEQQLAQCTTIKNPLKRLVCFDDVAAGNLTSDAAAAADTASPVAGTPANARAQERVQERANNTGRAQQNETEQSKRDRFGFEHLPDEKDAAEPDRMTIRIASHSRNKVGVLTIETTDGQVWEQISAERFIIKENEPYYLERGLFGSYFFLGRDDSPRRTRVKRIK